MFSLRQIELFISVSKANTLIDVANTFKMSQSAISMSLKELENNLDEKLFERVGKKLVLNERGRLFLKEVQPLFIQLKSLHQSFTQNHFRGEINVGASLTTAHYLMPQIITSYMRTYPDVSINLKMANTEDIASMVETGTVDLGLIEGSINLSTVREEVISSDELIVVTSNKELTKEKFIDQILDKQWILREKGSGTRSVFLNQIKPLDKELNLVLELEHTEAIKTFLILDKDYISCLPRISVATELKEGKLFHLPIKNLRFTRDFSLIFNKKRTLTLLMQDFHTHILKIIK
ncbi:LysR family transcriptional regulator [Sulfurimonas sp. MAG313]|nr:LysR substrate-binding domain-containing protein [Sulfurimonas sp. MAG313]MDF1880998.1 LysR family transcriptional regulator [Sulfurimonas sp. MAG313]